MPRSNFTFEAIGTFFEIVTKRELSSAEQGEVLATVEAFDKEFSRFREDSIVGAMAKSKGEYTFSKQSEPLFELYEELYKITDGKVSPLVGASVEALGYDANYSLKSKGAVLSPKYDGVIRRNKTTLTALQPVVFDVGAAGKGFLVDRIGVLLENMAISDYIIDASGDMLHKSKEVETVGLEDPIYPGKVIGEIAIENSALCASAVNRRKWGDGLHHVVDPLTGLPTQSIIATWVTATSTMLADGLATALFFTSPDTLKQRYTYEYMRVHSNKTIDYSKGFKNTIYKENS